MRERKIGTSLSRTAVLGHKPATQPAVVIDTLADNDVDLEGMESVSESTSTSKIDVMEEPGTSSTPRSKQRKRSKTDAFETALGSVVNKLLEAQNESEQRLLEFEEKRMKMEEAQRIQDRGLMQAEKREQRSFQLAITQMLLSVTQGVGNNTSTQSFPLPSYPPPFPLYQPFEEDAQ